MSISQLERLNSSPMPVRRVGDKKKLEHRPRKSNPPLASKALATSVLLLIWSCAHPEPSGLINAPIGATAAPPPPTAQSALRRFEKAAPEDSDERQMLLDVFHMLRAEALERRDAPEDAAKAWLQAAKIASGSFGDKAFRGWIRSLCVSLAKPADPDMLAKLIAAETNEGSAVPYMRKEGLLSADRYLEAVRKITPSCLPPLATDGSKDSLLPAAEISSDDKVWTRRATQFCKLKKSPNDEASRAWDNWTATLSEPEKFYWSAKTSECMEQPDKALHQYLAAAPYLLSNIKTAALGLECHERAVQLYRNLSQREAAARAYVNLTQAWDNSNVTPMTLGLSPKEFKFKRIDDFLWAGRYAAMIADYESAKRFAQDAINVADAAFKESHTMVATDREKLSAFKAEGYHLLAFRVAVEAQDYDGAIALSLVALQLKDLSVEWKERLTWYLGLYDFMASHYDDARRRWEGLLRESQDINMRPKLYYWLARTHKAMEQNAESEFYTKALIDDHPLSFYAVVAADVSRLKTSNTWKDIFKPERDLKREFVTFDSKDIDPLRKRSNRLLIRAEVLTRAKLTEYARLAIKELEPHIDEARASEKSIRQRLYLIRLNYAAGNYARAIKMTSDLANEQEKFWQKYPEHIFAFFPQPFADFFESNSVAAGLDPTIALGIGRQESSFEHNIKSPAQAVGIMQLLPLTAMKHNQALNGFSSKEVAGKLLDPATNIQSGVAYLKSLYRYYNGGDSNVFAAYNAGEFAVDGWVQRRPNPDPVTWVEMIPFGETQGYVKNVWRNIIVYRYLRERFGEQMQMADVEISRNLNTKPVLHRR